MNFDLTEEQQMLKDSVSRFVQDQYDFESRRQIANSGEGFSREHWQTFADLGWLSIPFREEHGGFGGGAIDTMVVMEELGKGLVLEPYVATVLLFGGLLQHGGSPALQDNNIGQIIDGKLQGAFAFLERQSRFEMSDVKTVAQPQGDHFLLSGSKSLVMNGTIADKMIVSARTSGAQSDEHGISLFLIDANTSGIEKTAVRLMDGQVVANISLNDVQVPAEHMIGELDQGYPLMQGIVDQVTVALCGEALGIMETLNNTTIEYTKTREQFGVKIGSFQALQHRMVDMFMACEQCKSLLYRAVCSMEEQDLDDENAVQKNILALKVMIGRAGKLIGGEAIQLHGGMGMTDELDVGHYVKRLMTINTTFGDADYHQQKFIAMSQS